MDPRYGAGKMRDIHSFEIFIVWAHFVSETSGGPHGEGYIVDTPSSCKNEPIFSKLI